MEKALIEAKKSFELNDVPVGAVIVHQNEIVSTAHNLMKTNNCALDHAELICLKKALEYIKTPFLSECDLYVTLEPCPMCAGAIAHARIRRLYYGASDAKGGGVENNSLVFESSLHKPEVYGGIMAQESEDLLKEFFLKLR